MTMAIQTALTALAAGTLSVILGIVVIRGWDRMRGTALPRSSNLLDPALRPMVFLFRDRMLIDATPPARALLDSVTGTSDEWTRLTGWLAVRIPQAAAILSGPDPLPPQMDVRATPDEGGPPLRLQAEDLGSGLLRLTVTDPTGDNAGVLVDALVLQAIEEELDLLRQSMDQTPMLVWREDAEGRITWANAAYLQRAEALAEGRVAWPLPRLLETPRTVSGARRAQIDLGGTVLWYDCHSHRTGDQTMMFALPADAAVRAERSLREFVQTLTKTFADLPTGLAIFDRDRKLQLFNPSLIDLTNLPTGFLTARPTLFDFLDQLREGRMVPEPKDYRSWRQQMSHLESAAATGRHVETWSLPGGQTYRVTGRPHPDGALAFLFEDITSEITLTRKFRSELTLGAQVFDGVEDALAVFGPDGQPLMSNRAYADLWGTTGLSLAEAVDHWDHSATAGEGFRALRHRLTGAEAAGAPPVAQPARDSGAMLGPDGRLLSWRVLSMAGGRLMVRFRRSETEEDRPAPEIGAEAVATTEDRAPVRQAAAG